MTIQPVSALVAAIVSFAIGGSVLLREPRRRAHVLFATFTFNIALYSLLSFVAKRFDAPLFGWASLLVAVSLPATAQRFFQAFLGDDAGPPPLSRSTVVGAAVFYTVLGFSRFIEPLHATVWFGVAFTAYVFAGLYLSVFYLYRRYRATPSRIEKTRLLYLVVGGIATVTSALLEAIPRGPSFGNVFIIVYLYFLSQNLIRYRLLDLNELLGRMVVLGTLVFILTLIYGVLVRWVGPDEQGLFFFNTLLASATIVILIEPLRTRVEGGISRWMFQEKFELSRRIEMLRAEMANVIDMRVLVPRVLGALEDSRRITHASIYLADPDGSGFELARARRAAARGAVRRDHAARLLRAPAPRRRDLAGGDRARGHRPPDGVHRGAGEPAGHAAHARTDERLGRARLLERGPAARRARHPRRAPARGLFDRRDRALPGGRDQHRHHPAELAGLRAHEGARPSGGARPDGGGPGARDPQPARLDQGRRAVPACRASSRRRDARAPGKERGSSSTSSSRRSTA